MATLFPLAYTTKVKRPNERYVLHGILGYDYAVILLAYAPTAPNPFAAALCLLIYLLAFFSVYEIGYWENDRVAAPREARPRVSDTFATIGQRFSPALAWCFGIGLLLIGAALQVFFRLCWPELSAFPRNEQFVVLVACGLGLLIGTRFLFWLFNRLDPAFRFLPMLPMQLARTLGYALLLPLSFVGGLFCVSHAIGRWTAYAVYRAGGERRLFPAHLMTVLVFLCVAGVALAFDARLARADLWQLAIIAIYAIARAAIDLRNIMARLGAWPTGNLHGTGFGDGRLDGDNRPVVRADQQDFDCR